MSDVKTMAERISSLRRDVQVGLGIGMKLFIADTDVLAAVLQIGETLYCEHGIKDGEWCLDCNVEFKRAGKSENQS